MDELNNMMDHRSLNVDMKKNLRQYFMLEKNKNETEVLQPAYFSRNI